MHENDSYIKPHKITDEYYYIGTRSGPANLLVTGDGLVLIDTSWPENLDILLENIRALGFDPMDVRHIVHSHGHLDHFGCTAELVRMTGAKTYLGEGDLPYLDPEDARCPDRYKPYVFVPDVIIRDGDVIDFGGIEIRFVSTPGHTYGVVSMFMTLHANGEAHMAGMFGGAGLNTLSDEFFAKGTFPKTMRNLYVESIDRIIDEPVEIHLGNHLANNNGYAKMKLIGGEVNPYLAENTWVSFLTEKRAAVAAMIAADEA